MPDLNLYLSPSFDNDGAAQYIDVRMTFDTTQKHKDDMLFHQTLARGPVPTMQYTADVIQLRDSRGIVPINTEDTKGGRQRNFRIERDLPPGRLIVDYRAMPREVNELTQCGPQIALEKDGRGLTGAGMAFIIGLASEDVLFDITIEWNLSSAPPGTRALCTFGEGQRVSTRQKASVLDECFFALGALKSYPPETTGGQYGMYWLDDPPFDASALGKQLECLLPKMIALFHDQESLYRIFIRRNVYKCVSGRGLHRGFVFAWTSVSPRDEDMITEFLYHEIVHNWPRLGFTTGGAEDLVDGWFNEGIAEYYSLILPYRFGIFKENEFVYRLNRRISGYYTNPDRSVPNKEVPEKFWQGGHINRIPYQRGFMYFMKLAYQLHQSKRRSLDALINEMVHLRTTDQPHGIKAWLSMVEVELGPGAFTDYRDMSDAKLIILPSDYLGTLIEDCKWTLERQDQEEFYLGFPEANLSTKPRIVRRLDPKSRAAEAGVREGDAVTQNFSYFFDAEGWDKSFTMTVTRSKDKGSPDELVELTWWPRTWEKVESYQFGPI